MEKGIFAKNSGGGDFELPEAGSYIAKCYRILDIGTQAEQFQGNPLAPKRKVLVYFELLEDEEGQPYRMANGDTFSVMKKYTLSTHPKANLRKDVDAWRGKPLSDEEAASFNVVKLLGQSCRVQVSLDESGDRTWVNVASVGFTKKDPKGVNPNFWWSIEEPDLEEMAKFPDWLRAKIGSAEEWDVVQNRSVAKTHRDSKYGDVVIEDVIDGTVDLSDIVSKF